MPLPVHVFVVEDSPVVRMLLTHIFSSDPALQIIGMASSGEEALEALVRCKPDVITMDIHLPGINGFETTRRIMETRPIPIVIVSASTSAVDVSNAFKALEAGALAVLEKPPGPGHARHTTLARKLCDTVRAMAEVRLVRRWAAARRPAPGPPIPQAEDSQREIRVVAIGASTGGPPVLGTILTALPKPFPVPILIVQHISAGFTDGLARWLAETAGVPVEIAADGLKPLAGTAYLAPDDCHMRLERDGRVSCRSEPPEGSLRPAVSVLFRSVVEALGRKAVGVLLTGMGRDGADELKQMRDQGAVTIAQDKESCAVYGMPAEAAKIEAAVYVLSPEAIAAKLAQLCAMQAARPIP